MIGVEFKKSKNGIVIFESRVRRPINPNLINLNREFIFESNLSFRKDIKCDLSICACRYNPFIWISHKHQAIWFENPKVASRSILNALGSDEPDISSVLTMFHKDLSKHDMELYMTRDLFHKAKDHILPLFNSSNNRSNVIRLLMNKLFLKKEGDFELFFDGKDALEKYSSYFKFGVIRNPFDRFVSSFNMFTQSPQRKLLLDELFKSETTEISFDDFFQKAMTNRNHHWEKQTAFLPRNIDFISKQENLNQDWLKIKKIIGISGDLERLNYTKYSNRNRLKAYQLKKIEKEYNEDIELYNSI